MCALQWKVLAESVPVQPFGPCPECCSSASILYAHLPDANMIGWFESSSIQAWWPHVLQLGACPSDPPINTAWDLPQQARYEDKSTDRCVL